MDLSVELVFISQAHHLEQVGFEPTMARNIPYSLPSNPAVREHKAVLGVFGGGEFFFSSILLRRRAARRKKVLQLTK